MNDVLSSSKGDLDQAKKILTIYKGPQRDEMECDLVQFDEFDESVLQFDARRFA